MGLFIEAWRCLRKEGDGRHPLVRWGGKGGGWGGERGWRLRRGVCSSRGHRDETRKLAQKKRVLTMGGEAKGRPDVRQWGKGTNTGRSDCAKASVESADNSRKEKKGVARKGRGKNSERGGRKGC